MYEVGYRYEQIDPECIVDFLKILDDKCDIEKNAVFIMVCLGWRVNFWIFGCSIFEVGESIWGLVMEKIDMGYDNEKK